MSFVSFMRSPSGRAIRAVAGLAIIAGGIAIGGTGGTVIAVIGVVPLAAGIFNFCLVGPLFGVDMTGHAHAPH